MVVGDSHSAVTLPPASASGAHPCESRLGRSTRSVLTARDRPCGEKLTRQVLGAYDMIWLVSGLYESSLPSVSVPKYTQLELQL